MALPLPSALANARPIEDINSITYPQGIKSPELELNVNIQKGKFRYDRDFLLQFMNICREKPDNLPPLGDLGLEPHGLPQLGSRRNRTRSKHGKNKEVVAPLEVSANRWVATSGARGNNSGVDGERPEMVDRKLRALLNKLTMERFDTISDQVVAWANQSEREMDGQTLIRVTELVFESATNGTMFPDMYAHLCRKILEQISPNVQDHGIKNAKGKPFAGGQLFRKYLLNCCRKVFEQGWVTKETTAAAASQATEDRVIKEANEKAQGEEPELCSDEYYAVTKAKRHRSGLLCFVGELFMSQMVTERIVHEYIKKLLSNGKTEDVEIENLCRLLKSVGSRLDSPKARAHIDVYFSRMRELVENKNIAPRTMFMLQDVIELRKRRWVPRNAVAVPPVIAQAHEAGAKEKLAQGKDSYMRQSTRISRDGSRRDGNCGSVEPPHPDGWAIAFSDSPACQPPKAGDLTQFGKISKATPISFVPDSIFTKGTDSENRESLRSKHNWPSSQRPKQLLPWSKLSEPVGEESIMSTQVAPEYHPNNEATGKTGPLAPATTLSEAESKSPAQGIESVVEESK